MAANMVEEIRVRESGVGVRQKEETGTEAVAFDPGTTRLFSLSHEWVIDPATFASHFLPNKTHAQLKATLVLKRIPWLLLCHRKTFNSYRQSFLFSVEPRDASPDELRIHKAAIRVRPLQANGAGPPPPNPEHASAASTFVELDLSNFAVVAFRVKFTLEGEVMLGVGEGKDSYHDDVTQHMSSEPNATCRIRLQDGQEVVVHKGVLVGQSAVFAAMLREEGLRESREALVEIADLGPVVVRALLHWLYTARIPTHVQAEEDAAMLSELFLAADKYGVGRLRGECESLLRENLCNDSVCTVFALADTFQATELKDDALQYLLANFDEVRQLSYFERLVTLHPHLSLEILRSVTHN